MLQKSARARFKILIAEDDPVCQGILRKYLEPFGTCREARNGSEALDLFLNAHAEAAPYQILFLDIMLPYLDGQDVLTSIRKWEKGKEIHLLDGVRVVMITALKDKKSIFGSFHRGCQWYLIKPLKKRPIMELMTSLNLKPGGVPA